MMKRIRLTLDHNRDASAFDFFSAGNELLELIDCLSAKPLAWKIADLKLASAAFDLAPSFNDLPETISAEEGEKIGDDAISLVTNGLLEIGAGRTPTNWNPNAIESSRQITKYFTPIDGESRAVLSEIEYGRESNVVDFTPYLIARDRKSVV